MEGQWYKIPDTSKKRLAVSAVNTASQGAEVGCCGKIRSDQQEYMEGTANSKRRGEYTRKPNVHVVPCQVLWGTVAHKGYPKCKTLVSEISVASNPPYVSESCRLFKNNNTKY